jgi:hypothetical protein
MMNKEFKQAFVKGFFSIFDFVPSFYKERNHYGLLQYFQKIEKYINLSFKNIRAGHERD